MFPQLEINTGYLFRFLTNEDQNYCESLCVIPGFWKICIQVFSFISQLVLYSLKLGLGNDFLFSNLSNTMKSLQIIWKNFLMRIYSINKENKHFTSHTKLPGYLIEQNWTKIQLNSIERLVLGSANIKQNQMSILLWVQFSNQSNKIEPSRCNIFRMVSFDARN